MVQLSSNTKSIAWLSSAINSMFILFTLSQHCLFVLGGSMSPKGLMDDLAASEAVMADALAATQTAQLGSAAQQTAC